MIRTCLALGAMLLAATPAVAQRHTSVRGYTRSNGTYVMPHHRTTPNATRNDNWTTRPNVNPYTGRIGTRSPDYRPAARPQAYRTY